MEMIASQKLPKADADASRKARKIKKPPQTMVRYSLDSFPISKNLKW